MELDDLKGAWKKQTKRSDHQLLNDEELHAMLRAKATNTVDLLKNSVHFELWSNNSFL